ncbi:MAG TPA: Rrf2 family transcriptional regulator [Caulobacteraceae bacterium]|jgi:DNA-binding IscR family transcriptional regulator|nr:Rrf2 family transcriptional regulator [Caulobacteraceae bacterium]
MSDSQRFPVAAHVLAYLAHKDALSAASAVCSSELAQSVATNPVVVRRVTAMLARAGLIGTRRGATGGAWLMRPACDIGLDAVLKAVNGSAHVGVPPVGSKHCPVGERLPKAVQAAINAADEAAARQLGSTSVADLLAAE